jgi:hypothetical protein
VSSSLTTTDPKLIRHITVLGDAIRHRDRLIGELRCALHRINGLALNDSGVSTESEDLQKCGAIARAALEVRE